PERLTEATSGDVAGHFLEGATPAALAASACLLTGMPAEHTVMSAGRTDLLPACPPRVGRRPVGAERLSWNPSTVDDVDRFELSRSRLEAIAYRLLGSAEEAEDVVQETFLRWQATDIERVEVPEAWLTKVLT